MKIFKNRGDIYVPKSVRASKQAKVLYLLLAFIVVFTAVFIGFLSKNYNSAAEFFAKGELTVTEELTDSAAQLPKISGKTNYLIIGTDNDYDSIHFIFFLQADKTNKAYKAACISPKTVINNQSVQKIYKNSGVLELEKRLVEYFGFEFDYYALFDDSSFVEFVNKLGTFVYASGMEIDYSGGKEDDKYTLKINQGEQKISGRETANLLRYFSEKEKNFALENELVLRAMTGLITENNYDRADLLFRLFMKSAKTDVTVRDFETAKDSIKVFSTLSNEITLYSSNAQYDDKNVLTQSSLSGIKGYFSK